MPWITIWPLSLLAAGDDFVVGIGTHVTSDHGLDLISAAGISSLRDDIHWDEVEREKGVLIMPGRYERYVNEALRRNITPVLVLCYGNKFYDGGDFPASQEALEAYARFAEFVVKNFKGRVRYYEVWNEWNYGIGLPTPPRPGAAAGYVTLLAKVYPRLKAADPQIAVIGGAMSGNGNSKGWFETACKAGLLDHLDALSYHPYCWRSTGVERTPEEGLMKLVNDNFKIAQHYHPGNLPVYITEIGWPTHTGNNSTTSEDSARFLARTYLLMRSLPFIKGVWWYDFRDDGARPDPNDPEHNFGIVSNNLTPKPAYIAMREICKLFGKAHFVRAVPSEPGVNILEFRLDSGNILLALWRIDNASRGDAILESSKEQMPLPVRITEMGGTETTCKWAPQGRLWHLPLITSPTPCVVDTGLVEVKVLADGKN